MAEPANQSSSEGDKAVGAGDDVNKGDSVTFTQEQLGQKLSEERKKMREQFEAEKQQAIKDAQADFERKSKLSEDDKKKEEFSERERQLAEREAALNSRELRNNAIAEMQVRNLPIELVDSVVGKDDSETKEKLDAFEKVWIKSIEDAVKAKIDGGTPSDKSNRTPTQTARTVGRDNGLGVTSF